MDIKKFNEKCLDYLENRLSVSEKQIFENALKDNPENLKNFNQFKEVLLLAKQVNSESHKLDPSFSVKLMDKVEQLSDNERFMKNEKSWFAKLLLSGGAVFATGIICIIMAPELAKKIGYGFRTSTPTIDQRGDKAKDLQNTKEALIKESPINKPEQEKAEMSQQDHNEIRYSKDGYEMTMDAIMPMESDDMAISSLKSEPRAKGVIYPPDGVMYVEEKGSQVKYELRGGRWGKANNEVTASSKAYMEPSYDDYDPYSQNYSNASTEEYDNISENEFKSVNDEPLSTFSIDVDSASYTNIRRYLNSGSLPPKNAIRVEEFINYFNYDYKKPEGDLPFSINTELSSAPWNEKRQLIHIGLQGRVADKDLAKSSNLVFLIDVSGSMSDGNKLPLLKQAFKMLVNQLGENDTISIVTYAGRSGLVLPPTDGKNKAAILSALDRLYSGGGTAGAAGINLAYKVAKDSFIEGGNNRVILATDGDFNVGVSSDQELISLIEEKRNDKIFLTVLGFGSGNLKDSKMEKIANKGNGNYYYIDNFQEAEKVFVSGLRGTLFTIAKDVKIQVEFNPKKVKAYRLIGYENRKLAKEDFNDDTKDAGELGAGHTVTALYEIIPANSQESVASVDELKYGGKKEVKPEEKEIDSEYSNEVMTIKLRYKNPEENTSKLIESVVLDSVRKIAETTNNFRFSAAVAEFGMLLSNSRFKSESSYDQVIELAREARGDDDNGYRSEFIRLVKIAKGLNK